MRLLREFPEEAAAQRVLDALSDQGIEAELKRSDASYAIWVIDENHLAKANDLARGWLDGAERDAFMVSAARGRRARELAARVEERRQRHRDALTQKLQALARPRPVPLTLGLIALCVAIGALTQLGMQREMVAKLTIVDPRLAARVTLLPVFGVTFAWLELPLAEPWRLVTPILVHFGWPHVVFNLMSLYLLGRPIESVHGSRYLAVFILFCAVVSNIAEYEISQRPQFAGMSGVVYGLLGIGWLRGKLDPWIGYRVSRQTMQFMMIWFALGFFPNFAVANYCHLFGLLFGLAWAYVSHRLSRMREG